MFAPALVKKFVRFAVPSVISMWIFSLYTMVDGLFVAKGVGELALASVNIPAPSTSALFPLGMLFAAGASTVTAILLGQGKQEEACCVFTQNILTVTVVSVAVAILTLLNLDRVVAFLGATPSTWEYVRQYVAIIACFSPFFTVSYNLEVLVKTGGAPHISTIGVTSCALTNVGLDALFVLGFGWGVWGAALATGIAQVISTLIFLIYFVGGKRRLAFRPFRWNGSALRRILPIGLADAVTELSAGAVTFLFNHAILRHIGEGGLVSYTVIAYLNTLVLMTMTGIAQGMQPLVSYHFGKGEQQTCHRLFALALTTSGALALLSFFLCQVGGTQVFTLFLGADSALLADSVQALRIFSLSFLLLGFNVVSAAFFAALERPRFSFPLSTGRGLVVIAGCLMVLPVIWGQNGVWLAPAVSEGLCLLLAVVFLLVYFREACAEKEKSFSSLSQDLSI